jgi:protein TonB
MLAKNPDIELTTDESGLKITPKTKDVGEIAVVGYGEQTTKQDSIFYIVEVMPEFPGGDSELRKFISRSVQYPEVAKQNGIQGKVYVTFVVEKDGSVARMKVARGVDPSLDKEALRVVSSLPKWTPGKLKGRAVAVSYTVPISFVLQ